MVMMMTIAILCDDFVDCTGLFVTCYHTIQCIRSKFHLCTVFA